MTSYTDAAYNAATGAYNTAAGAVTSAYDATTSAVNSAYQTTTSAVAPATAVTVSTVGQTGGLPTETVTTSGGGTVEIAKAEVSADYGKAKEFATGERSYNVPGLGEKKLKGWMVILAGLILLILFILLINWIFGWGFWWILLIIIIVAILAYIGYKMYRANKKKEITEAKMEAAQGTVDVLSKEAQAAASTGQNPGILTPVAAAPPPPPPAGSTVVSATEQAVNYNVPVVYSADAPVVVTPPKI